MKKPSVTFGTHDKRSALCQVAAVINRLRLMVAPASLHVEPAALGYGLQQGGLAGFPFSPTKKVTLDRSSRSSPRSAATSNGWRVGSTFSGRSVIPPKERSGRLHLRTFHRQRALPRKVSGYRPVIRNLPPGENAARVIAMAP